MCPRCGERIPEENLDDVYGRVFYPKGVKREAGFAKRYFRWLVKT